MLNLMFLINSFLLGVGLSEDAFCVTLSNGISCPQMSKKKGFEIVVTFSVFQGLMTVLGWILVKFWVDNFASFKEILPFIGGSVLIILGLLNFYSKESVDKNTGELKFSEIFIQGIATSIDAMTVGLNTANLEFHHILICSSIICVTTFTLCFIALHLGKVGGGYFAKFAPKVGGVLLFIIGLEIVLAKIL